MKEDSEIYIEHETLPMLTEEEKKEEWNLLSKNLNLVLKHQAHITREKKFFFTKHHLALIGSSITGTMPLTIGILLEAWNEELFIETCPHCEGRVYILGSGGSLFSGHHFSWGCCIGCRERIDIESQGGLGNRIGPVREIAKNYLNYRKIRRYALQSEKWFDKLTEKRQPEEVITESIKGASFKELITWLKELESK